MCFKAKITGNGPLSKKGEYKDTKVCSRIVAAQLSSFPINMLFHKKISDEQLSTSELQIKVFGLRRKYVNGKNKHCIGRANAHLLDLVVDKDSTSEWTTTRTLLPKLTNKEHGPSLKKLIPDVV